LWDLAGGSRGPEVLRFFLDQFLVLQRNRKRGKEGARRNYQKEGTKDRGKEGSASLRPKI